MPDVVNAGSEFEISVRAGKPERHGLAERNQADQGYWQQVEAVAHRNGDPGRVWSAVFGQGWLLSGRDPLPVSGGVPRAHQIFTKALEIAEANFGPRHLLTAVTLEAYGVHEYMAGDHDKAQDALERSLEIKESLAGHRMDGRRDAVAEVWDALIRSRAMVVDQIASRHVAIAGSGDPELTRLAEEHDAASVRLANLMVRGPSGQSRQDHRRAVEAAKAMKAQAEEVLAARSEKFRKARLQERAGLEEVLWNLPEGSALVGIRVHRSPTFPPPPGPPPKSSAYTAFVVNSPRSNPVIAPLGPAEKIDEAVECWREAVTASATGRPARRCGR